MLVFDEFGLKISEYNGKCANCNQYNTSSAWYQTCDSQKITQGWTSGNKDIDDCIKKFKLNKMREMDNAQIATDITHRQLGAKHVALRKQHKDGQVEIRMLLDNIQEIAKGGFGYRNYGLKKIKSYIADLGLSRNNKESTLKKGIYGVMPFIPPEILLGQKYIQAADIYGFGVVIAEITTEILSFDGYLFVLFDEFSKWYDFMNKQDMDDKINIFNKLDELDEKSEISNKFWEADDIIQQLPIIIQKNLDSIYTNRFVNINAIS
ncbi:hypothetical protein C2G38_2218457 [Gigaspora rosea]|uniref:Protein kinase domain-containing protein n=1 Tax=Gigaspora rosea TaxID=44941 RepID=A0A397UA07_9GLOM|nr:hypothetical protein C2G38_2218457 [Gigaspora rosea]